MARSESTVTAADGYHIEYTQQGEEARLVVSNDAVTVTVEGSPDAVHRQFTEYQAAALNLQPDVLSDAIDDLPMPELDDLESIPADEFYDE